MQLSFENVGLLRGDVWLIKNLNWKIRSNEHWVILGANGAGKSTLAALALARLWPTKGKVSVLGKDYKGENVQSLSAQIGFFQPAQQAGLFRYHADISVLEVVLTGFDGSIASYRNYTDQEKESALSLLKELFFDSLCHYSAQSPFCRLSTGEQRQVLFLRSIVQSPSLLILDEPFASFDIRSRLRLEHLLKNIASKYLKSSVLILHRIEEIPPFVSHALLLKNGKAIYAGPIAKALQGQKITDLYEYPLEVHKREGRFFCFPKKGTDRNPPSFHSVSQK